MRNSMVAILAVIVALIAAVPAAARADVEGRARPAEDGGLLVGERAVGLWGIVVPPESLACDIDGERWLCGRAMRFCLKALLGRKPVRCEIKGRGADGAVAGECFNAGARDSINALMLQRGCAAIAPEAPADYRRRYDKARADRRGLWRAAVPPPDRWR